MLKAKRVYDPPAAADGLRVLVMRLWPRGIRKEAVDLWLKELGADVANLRAWKAGRMDWPEMRRRYMEGLAAPAAAADLARLEALARRRTVTVLCGCVDEQQCHRGILKEILGRRQAGPPRRASAPTAPANERTGNARPGARSSVAADDDATKPAARRRQVGPRRKSGPRGSAQPSRSTRRRPRA
jgi:uncharacterized protein YeaO (DUF488 family)